MVLFVLAIWVSVVGVCFWCSGRDLNPGSMTRKATMLVLTTPPEPVVYGGGVVYNGWASG